MTHFARRILTLGTAMAAITIAVDAGPAHAQGFFERLFGPPIRDRPVRYYDDEDFAPRPRRPAAPPKPTPTVRIEGPQYYAYKADPLVRVKIAPVPAAMTAATPAVTGSATTAIDATATDAAPVATPAVTPIDFRDQVPVLDGLDLYAEKDIAAALAAHYDANPSLLWSDGKDLNAKSRDVARVLADAAAQGLDAGEYDVPAPAETTDSAQRKADLTRYDIALSARVLRYIRDIGMGRISPNRISGYYDLPNDRSIDLKGKLEALAQSSDVAAVLDQAHPQNADYAALVAELKTLRASADTAVAVDPKLTLKPGESSPELPKLLTLIARKTGNPAPDVGTASMPDLYGPDKVAIVKEAQRGAGLRADGVIGPRTVAAFSQASVADRLAKVQIALEQMRWLPSELGTPRVFVNEPAYTASYIGPDNQRLTMDVVVGGTKTQTPFFYDEVEQVDYNPYWGVPASILVNEMLPKLLRDPGYLDQAGYEVFDGKGKKVPSSSVSWGSYGSKIPFDVRQIPSEANALGELKILFPNKNAIYMHDTPQKAFFSRDMRALSHGCIRLSNPRGMAAAVLGSDVTHVDDKLKQGHSSEKVPVKIPIYIAYFTAWPNADGKVEYFKDVYGRDPRIEAAIKATEAVRAPTG